MKRPAPAVPPTILPPRRFWLRALALAPLAALAACGGGGASGADATPAGPAAAATAGARRWRMGFGGMPPRLDVDTARQGIDLWSQRAEIAAIHEEIPWTELLTGTDPQTLVERDKLPLVSYYRSKGLKLLFVAELNDGLARDREAPQLRALGRSLTEPAVQQAWRSYVMAVSRLLQPDWLCLAAETNLVRAAAPPALYAAVVATAGAGAADLRAAALPLPPVLLTSVQVETAWGVLPGQDGSFQGIAQDRQDFAFAAVLGLSSYPYLAYGSPDAIPADHYRRVAAGSSLPLMVTECGWSSTGAVGRASSEVDQAGYLGRHATLLDGVGAVGVVQLIFADPDPSLLAAPGAQDAANFAHIGLTHTDFTAKPALAAWDGLHARPLA